MFQILDPISFKLLVLESDSFINEDSITENSNLLFEKNGTKTGPGAE